MLTQSTLLNYRFLSESALASAGSQPDDDLDMIKFLAVVEALNIEVLPITWQAAREPIGWGATSQVTEAQATVQTSFAFKRASEEQKQVGLPKVLRAMLNEITVLSHPSVRMHPGVVELQGICWDVQSVHDVWPVVVFRKSHFGNLYDFATMPAGRALSLPQRLDLCVEIGSAVVSMHANNIVHGDLKPENILIFQDEKDVYSAKVSDFGYSTRFFKPDDVCPMPRSRPWDAPEHHFNMFNMSDARKMDIFSFGLVCCWILFEKYLARVATLPASLQWAEDLLAPKSSLDCSKESISELKRLKKILAFAEQLLITDDDLEAEPKAAMLKFLRASLVYEQDLRSHDLHACFHYFVPSTLSSHTKIDDPTSSISSASFDMTRILEDLYASDYRVRKYLRRTLEELVNDQNRDKMHSEQQNLAFQLAICTKIGFGAPKDDVRVSDFLSRCQKPLEELQGALEKLSVVGSARATNNLTTWHILRNDEHVRLINLAEQYTQVDEIGVAMEEFSKELSDIENTLGRNNGLWSFHAHTMCLFYEKLGHWNSEMQILQQMLEKDEKDTTLVLNLAQTYRRMGRYSEAETLQDRAMEQLLEEGKENDLGLYYCMNDLAMTYKDQGRFEEAVNLLSGAIPAFKRLLGSEHPSTLSKVSNLGTIYQAQYRWAEATALFIEVKDTCSSILGERHPFSLTSTGNLADVYNVQNRYKEAEIMLEKIINIATDALGPNSDITLRTRCSLASSYAGQGQFKRAAEELEQALSVLEEEFGDDYPRTIDVRTTLGDTYCRMGLYGKAETLHFSTSMKLESVRGANHPSTILAVNSLAMTFREQGRTGDAEQIMQKNLQRCESAFGPLHYTTLHMQLDLAAIFMDQGRLEEAEDLMEHILRQEARMHDRDQMLRIDTLTKLVTVYRCQSRLEEAEKLGVEVIETRTALQGDGHSFVLESKNNLGSVLMEMGKLDDAVSLFTGVINVKEAQGVRDSVWLASKYCLVASYTAAKDWGEAVESGIEVLQIAERALGTGHRLWIKAADHVLLAYGNLGNVADFEDLKEEVLEAKEDTWKEISIDQVHAFDTISSILVEQGNLAGAQEIEEQKLHMLRELRGEDHFDTIASNGLLAWICEKNGQWTKAERLKLEVIDKNSSTLGLDHEHTVKCMEDTATFYRRRGDLENAEKLTLRVMEIRQRSLGNSHHETRETMKYLAAVMIARGKHIEARRMEETFGLLISESSS